MSPIRADYGQRAVGQNLYGKPCAPLGATSAQDPAPAGRLHAAAKAVGPLAPDNRRLESAFHEFTFFGKSLLLELVAMVLVKVISRPGFCG
jgi:hypothetical protein